MIKTALACVLCLIPARPAQAASWRAAWRWSEAALIAGRAADVATSWGGHETNPVLGRGRYGARQASIEFAATGAALVVEEMAARHRAPAKHMAITNLATGAVLGGIAVRNTRVK